MVPSQKSPLSAKNNLATWIRKCQQMPKAVVFSYKEILFQWSV